MQQEFATQDLRQQLLKEDNYLNATAKLQVKKEIDEYLEGKEVMNAKIEGVYEKIMLFGKNHEYEHQDHLLYNDLNELLKLT